MKITKRQLRNIIREAIAHPRHGLGKNVADVEFPILVGYSGRSEIAYDEDDLDSILDSLGADTPYSLDSLEDIEPVATPVGADIEELQLSAPTAAGIKRLKQGLRRQKRPRSPGDFRSPQDRWDV